MFGQPSAPTAASGPSNLFSTTNPAATNPNPVSNPTSMFGNVTNPTNPANP